MCFDGFLLLELLGTDARGCAWMRWFLMVFYSAGVGGADAHGRMGFGGFCAAGRLLWMQTGAWVFDGFLFCCMGMQRRTCMDAWVLVVCVCC